MSNVPSGNPDPNSYPNNPDSNSYPANPGGNPYSTAPSNPPGPGYPNQSGAGSFPHPGQNAYPNTHGAPRRWQQGKPTFLTTEFIVFVVVSLAVLIAAAVVDNDEDAQGFGADKAWLYVTILAVAYMISRGIAKSGRRSRHHSDE
ncbi:hypothetical protein [Microbacterium sp. JZ31]|uniref:hypothetical protein n=1 Tax=Microbacterium sp. JZ31 TaxID=1906274 RepID=UPI001933B447|nr:hypothetical protein [Microbacterium sp. JZ31]